MGSFSEAGAKQTVLEGFDAEFEVALFVAPLLAKLPQQSDRFLRGSQGLFGVQ